VRDTRGSDIDGACGQLAAADIVEGVPSVASSLAETVSAAVERPRPEARPELARGEEDGVLSVVPLGAAPEDTE
jgi:23S rRNA (adenine2503-C2)-methyltransferase